jgi:cellulose synthase/poly-beta-1,6-N-acetylglucosamine synthase-like glycosyltransferase
MKKGLLHKPFFLFDSILGKIVLTHAVVIGVPTVLYFYVLVNGGNLLPLHLFIPLLYTLTAVVVVSEAIAAIASYRRTAQRHPTQGFLQRLWTEHFKISRPQQPRTRSIAPRQQMPKCSLVVVAYLPNEQHIILDTLRYILDQVRRPPAGLEVILAYNTPLRLPVEAKLEQMALIHPELKLLKVEGSRSKAENINAALQIISGEITGILDADHRPIPDCFERAWRCLATGQYAAVQGRNVIRNHRANFLTRMIAVEFECMYGISHPAKSMLVDTGMFCGSNGYWRTNVLRRIRFSPKMMTEDIDATLRTLLRGYNIFHDPNIVTTELAPVDCRSFWFQRKRWAQGWLEVALKHQIPLLRSGKLDTWQKLYWTMLLVYSAAFHFVALQVFSICSSLSLSQMESPPVAAGYVWMTTCLTLISGPIQTLAAWSIRHRASKQPFKDYLIYCLFIPFYCLFKNIIAIIAIYDHLIGHNEWVVTNRGLRETLPAVAPLPYVEIPDQAS